MRFGQPMHTLSKLPRSWLQLIVGGLIVATYAFALVALKWWGYPGWTWRGFLTDLKTLLGLVASITALGFWLWQVYRVADLEETARAGLRQTLQAEFLPALVCGLLSLAAALCLSLLVVGERSIANELLLYADQSNWKHAREYLGRISKDPVRPEILDTFALFISVHELSERDRLKESRSLREDRDRVSGLLKSGADYYLFNTLSYAELSKAIYFLEKADESGKSLNEGLQLLRDRVNTVSGRYERAVLFSRLGELNLAAKDYLTARVFFDQALQVESNPARIARLRANLGNTYAATQDLAKAVSLYANAEKDYPEGRRSVFYSNFGYLLMLAKDFDSAKRKIERALEIDPTDWYSYLNLGLIKEALKDYDDASEDFKRVIAKSENPDSQREARILAGRCLELAGKPPAEYLALYLEADGRSTAKAQVERLANDTSSRAALYRTMAKRLQGTNTHGIEPYIDWFVSRAQQLSAAP